VGHLVGNVRNESAAIWLAVVPREYVGGGVRIRRPDSSPDNVGHRRGFIAEAVLPGSVSARLRKELTSTFGKGEPPFLSILEPPGRRNPGQGMARTAARYASQQAACVTCGSPDASERPVIRRCAGKRATIPQMVFAVGSFDRDGDVALLHHGPVAGAVAESDCKIF